MADNISGLRAAYPITIRGHYKAPYHKSLDKQIDKLLGTKSNKITTQGLPVPDVSHVTQAEPVFPIQTRHRGEAISPQAADVVDQVLGKVAQLQPPQSEAGDQSYHRAQDLQNISERLEEREPVSDELERDDIGESKHFDSDSRNRYRLDSSNLSINSDEIDDIDREALEPEGESPPPNYSQKLHPSQFSSNFSAEEARLRYSLDYAHADLKERFRQYSSTSFNEEEWKRRFSLPDTSKDNGKNFSLSNPTSPTSKPLSTSPLGIFRGQVPRSQDESDYALTPRVKEGLYFCHLCSFSGTTQADFDLHMTCHFEHVCPHCDYKSRTEGRLKRHIKDFHTDDGEFGARTMPGRPKVFKCKQCEFSTTEKIEFWTHSRRHIKEDKLLQCPRCPFVTEYKHHLEYHLRNHFGSKPFKCPKCNYACVNKSMLNSHMKSHTNVYQYRCADCTYATKYCHSLKLHLRKYNHKPAAVLNSDGSLPQGMDATASGLSLLAKRGPPRGPRGPRKDKVDSVPGHFLQMGASPMNRLPQGLPGMMSPYWPLLHGQMPNGMQFPLGLGPQFNAHLPPLPSPRDNPVIKKEEMISPTGVSPFKCNFCSFIGNNREVLTSHVVKVHASENQDLFSMFGISSEALLEENHKRMNALKAPLRSPRMFTPHLQLTPNNMKIKNEVPDDFSKTSPHSKQELFPEKSNGYSKEPLSLPSMPFMNNKLLPPEIKDEGIDILKQMTLKFGSGPLDVKGPGTVESPLDLTKPRYSPPNMYSQQLSSLAEAQENRNEEGEHSSGENSNYSNDVASPTPRKRSRKGKAFKLDTLCLKLQEKKTGESCQSGEESNDDIEDGYSPGVPEEDQEEYYHKQRENGEYVYKQNPEMMANEQLTDNVEPKTDMYESKIQRRESGEKQEESREDDKEEQDIDNAEEDFKKVQESLSMLNNQSEEAEDNLVIDEGNSAKFDDDSKTAAEKAKDEMKDTNQSYLNGSINMPFYNKRQQIPAAIQRGADIAWKMLNNQFISDREIQNGLAKYRSEDNEKDFDGKMNQEMPGSDSAPEKDGSASDYFCPHCQIAFGDCIMYTMHMGYHGYKDPYKCNMCGDLCKDRVEFFLHIARAAHN